ncbi:MAG: hypothetical protein SV062_01705 [Thermodesulfobacteriota bacterium]|nr:hypothetical protein [Thermodesulfobacteriota bacterium]
MPEELEGKELTPLCIAIKRIEAKNIESVLDRSTIDYTFEITPTIGKSIFSIIFGSVKKGVIFLVPNDQYEYCKRLLEGAGLANLIIE